MLALVVAFALGSAVAGGAVFALTRPSQAGELRAESAQRDRAQIKTLTELARATRTRLVPVLDGLGRAIPADATTHPVAGPVAVTDGDVAAWQKAAAAAVEGFADPPSGETATNVARASLASAVRQIATTVDTYAAARTLAGPARASAMDLAVRQRADALFTWSVGATALDAVNVDAGYGHQHVFLPTSPGEGALTPDTEPEGSHDS